MGHVLGIAVLAAGDTLVQPTTEFQVISVLSMLVCVLIAPSLLSCVDVSKKPAAESKSSIQFKGGLRRQAAKGDGGVDVAHGRLDVFPTYGLEPPAVGRGPGGEATAQRMAGVQLGRYTGAL